MPIKKKTFWLAITIFGIIIPGILAHHYLFMPWQSQRLGIKAKSLIVDHKQWMGIYFKGHKIGYTVRELQQKQHGGNFFLTEESVLFFHAQGEAQKVKQGIQCVLGPNYELYHFLFRFVSNASSYEVEGEVLGQRLELNVISAGEIHKEEIRVKERPCLWATLAPYLSAQNLSIGQTYNLSMFQPLVFGISDVTMSVEGEEQRQTSDGLLSTVRLKLAYGTLETHLWMTASGQVVEEETSSGMRLIRETESSAVSGFSKEPVDVVVASAIPLPEEIPKNAKALTLQLKGFPLEMFHLTDTRQHLKGDLLTLEQDDLSRLPGYMLPWQAQNDSEDLTPYLIEELLVQKNAPQIVDQAKTIVGVEKNPLKAAKLIYEWVFQNIEKSSTISVPSALEVLKEKVGDCNEHTTLYTALARSLGIPTRMDIGLVAIGKNFFYHAWPSVYVGRWIPVDPTLGQFPADVSHLRFLSGSPARQTEIMKIIGKVQIQIVSIDITMPVESAHHGK